MATIKAEAQTLIGRCRRVGWKVVLQDSGQYKITFDDRSSYLIHQSYSDRNALKNVLRHLESKGLLDKENVLEEKHEADKAARLAAEEKKNAATTLRLAKRAAATATAAGPYAGPERVPLDWYLAQHPAMWTRPVIIDPPLAREIMKRNTDNRPSKLATVEFYRKLILDDRWHLTHQGMAMDSGVVLQDGQQRLQACIDADREISTLFSVGMRPENFKAIDEGRNRTISDLFSKDGIGDPNQAGGTMRLVAAYREPFPRAFLKAKTANEYLYDAFKGDPERLCAAVKWARSNAEPAKIVRSALGAAVYLLREANGFDNAYVEAFLNGLVTGLKGDSRLMLDADDPRLLLRQNMQHRREQGNRMRGVDQFGFVLTAWNLIVDRSQAGRRIRWTEGRDSIPQIIVCQDKGARASAPPEMLRGEFTSRSKAKL